jgi:hypothetical protein
LASQRLAHIIYNRLHIEYLGKNSSHDADMTDKRAKRVAMWWMSKWVRWNRLKAGDLIKRWWQVKSAKLIESYMKTIVLNCCGLRADVNLTEAYVLWISCMVITSRRFFSFPFYMHMQVDFLSSPDQLDTVITWFNLISCRKITKSYSIVSFIPSEDYID